MDFEAEKDVNQALKNTEYNLEDEEKILRHVNEHFGQNPKTLEKLSWKDFVPLVKVLKRSSKAIASHFQTFLLPIMLASIYDSKDFNSNPEWKDEFFKYIIEEKVESISDINWDHVLKEKPFLTKRQMSIVLSTAVRGVQAPMKKRKLQGPLYEQIEYFRRRIPKNRRPRRRRSNEQRKMAISQIYDEIVKAKSE